MGDIADMILNGDLDEETGEYIGKGQGFPRSLQRDKREKQNKNAKQGVIKWMRSQGVEAVDDMTILRGFVPNSTHNQSKESLCVYCSEHWQEFTKWFFENTKEVDE